MAMNLHSAVTKVTNIPTSLLLPPGSRSVYRMSRQFGGVGEWSPKAILRLGTWLFLQRRAKPRGRNLPLSGEFIK